MQRFKNLACHTPNIIMKKFLNWLAAIAGLLIFTLSCKKNKETPSSILGKWNIKIDTSFAGELASNHEVIYSGKPGDYFNFNSDGKVYIRENSLLDTLTYTVSSDSILIPNFNFAYEGKCRFKSASTDTIVISTGYFVFFGAGTFGRTVYLYR